MQTLCTKLRSTEWLRKIFEKLMGKWKEKKINKGKFVKSLGFNGESLLLLIFSM